MISIERFYALKLTNFHTESDYEIVTDYEYLEKYWQGEILGFSAFLSLKNDPTQKTRCVILDLVNEEEFSNNVLTIIAPEVKMGMNLQELTKIFGNKFTEDKLAQDRTFFEFDFDDAYIISCIIVIGQGLTYISFCAK